MWRPVAWHYGNCTTDVTCVGRILGGGRHKATFERCVVHAYVSGVDEADVYAALAPGATVGRSDVQSIYDEPRVTMLRVSAPTRAALSATLARLPTARTYESLVTPLTRLLQRERCAPHGLFTLDNTPAEDRDAPCGLVVAFLASTGVVCLNETLPCETRPCETRPRETVPRDVAEWLEANEVDVVVSLDTDVRCAVCVSVRLLAVLADGKSATLEQLARETLGPDAPTDELTFIQRAASELGVVEHLVELSNVTGVQMRELLRRGVLHRSLEQVLRAANEASYVLPDVAPRADRARLEGGLVLDPVVGVHREAVSVLDFRSMYPSLIMAKRLCYTSTGAVLPPLIRAMHAEREAVQRASSATDDAALSAKRRLDARQRALKLAMNCVFGMAACADGPLPCARLAAQITAAGREALRCAAKELAASSTVVYGDSVTEDTRVLVYSGGIPKVVTVAELFEHYEREPDAEPVRTQTLLGLAAVRAVIRRESSKPVFRVTLASGASVDVTSDHSLVAHDGSLVSPLGIVVGTTRLATRHVA